MSKFVLGAMFHNEALFDGIPPKDLSRLIQILHPMQADEGTVLARAGEPSNVAFLIRSGVCHALDSAGHVQKTLKVGDIFGELSMLDIELVRGSSLIALSDVEGYTINREDVMGVLDTGAVDVMTENALLQAISELQRNNVSEDRVKRKLLESKLHELQYARTHAHTHTHVHACTQRKRKHNIEDVDIWIGTSKFRNAFGGREKLTYDTVSKLFHRLDVDNSNSISRAEIEVGMNEMGMKDHEIDEAISGMHAEEIDLRGFLNLMGVAPPGSPQGTGEEKIRLFKSKEEVSPGSNRPSWCSGWPSRWPRRWHRPRPS